MAADPAARLLSTWRTCAKLPMGRALFAMVIRQMVPYSASVGPRVDVLEPGHARVSMSDRGSNRNHLGSVHAVALTNLGEFTSGIAMISALPPGLRSIVTRIEVEFTKKARGKITAEARVTVPTVKGPTDHVVVATLTDSAADVVAKIHVHWRLDVRA